MPDTENSRTNVDKGAEWVPGKLPVKQPGKTAETIKTAVFWMFRPFSGCFSALLPPFYPGPARHLFQLFAMWHSAHLQLAAEIANHAMPSQP